LQEFFSSWPGYIVSALVLGGLVAAWWFQERKQGAGTPPAPARTRVG
jgi:hypothetical protein